MGGEVWHIRGEGGLIWKMSLPLAEGMAARLASGGLVRVNPDGSPFTGEPSAVPAPAPAVEAPAPASLAEVKAKQELAELAEQGTPAVERPADSAAKKVWVDYAVHAAGGTLTRNAADDLTKAELIARYGG